MRVVPGVGAAAGEQMHRGRGGARGGRAAFHGAVWAVGARMRNDKSGRVPAARMGALEANLAVAVAVLLAGLSVLLAGVGILAYRRLRHSKLLWITLAFLGFAAEGVIFAWDAYERRGELARGWDAMPWLALLNLGIVMALYLAALKR